jgi:ubiquinone/menaquinone biosynthesis C-methylase UbiE
MRIKQARIARHLARGTRILDIGAGHGGLCRALRQEGFEVVPVDVKDLSLFPDVRPVIYDGKTLPFPGAAFDTSLLITMLHHTPDPEAMLREAMRVTKGRLVVMEDIYRNAVQRELTFLTDSLVNLEFEGHPHTNKTDAGWQEVFARLGLRVTHREEFRTLLFFRQAIYVLERAR